VSPVRRGLLGNNKYIISRICCIVTCIQVYAVVSKAFVKIRNTRQNTAKILKAVFLQLTVIVTEMAK